jgi:hypothetical protein
MTEFGFLSTALNRAQLRQCIRIRQALFMYWQMQPFEALALKV